ncbi:excinuclease ABC subunit UvrB [Flavobacteriaceae bacterium]|mgnify:FL=1|jgi:excinuclease ABC subunit B|nr:excinuclease ABC subunit UvrB [Cryomorphaceae bacterium]MDB3967667.1 excinuclease ABC subunit UvrB [Flavobacteriaceae bacterium]MBT3503696.1 excinuclease ABC subunit UvrB [Cryomorphaceae bacterium]MBT3689706.1 excinuclease ABC subunit UvrB [Cryomorphaceae bacterium]MBT4222707.1 excinuclease ABC subunit UvrB [Cryomorphaceae bacterium]
MSFSLTSEFDPTGDQPNAIKNILDSFNSNHKHVTLQGVTGSGKTFTVANVIQEIKKPTLVLAHNKTLAAQLYSEFQSFFPNNAVEYFVSYYDYYQPEAYIPSSGLYIEKDLSINEQIEKYRLSATSSLLSGRDDIIVVASVSCIYGIGNPSEFKKHVIKISVDEEIQISKLLTLFVKSQYSRCINELNRGSFSVKGDVVDIFPSYSDIYYRINFFGDTIESIESIDPLSGNKIENFDNLRIFPAMIFVTSESSIKSAINSIEFDLDEQVKYFDEIEKNIEAKRIRERTEFDLEMIKELGYCSGIENYSRYLDGRNPGTRPFCLLDYFPDDYLMVIDESHVTIPQVHAMYGGDRSRKENLVQYGFRLPAALDNRPLKFEEFEHIQNNVLYVSATPSDYELKKSEGLFVEQIIRPTGVLDPIIEVRKSENQIDDLIEEIIQRVDKDERIIVTTLTKRMAEELTKFLHKSKIRANYIHSDIDTLDRVEIMQNLRKGIFDVLVGVNLLREGLDLPEVSLVAILDADKEGFLRSHRSLIQTVGRAARNINGKSIMYADRITESMSKTIIETEYRRKKQEEYNIENNIVPKKMEKAFSNTFEQIPETVSTNYEDFEEEIKSYHNKNQIESKIKELRKEMETVAKKLDFLKAADLRDKIEFLKKKLK